MLFFFSGFHADYHKPSDTWDKINAPAATLVLDMVAMLRWPTARSRRIRYVVEKTIRWACHLRRRRLRALLRLDSRFRRRENGVRFSDVRPGSPAAKAGLKAGDILVKFGDKPIHNLYDFTDALRRSKIGQRSR